MAATTNYVTNPSFETNTTSWAGTLATIARETTQVAPGAGLASLKVTAAGGGAANVTYTGLTLTVGARYTMSAYVYVPSGSNFSLVLTAVAPTLTGVSSGGAQGRWSRLTWSFTATTASTVLKVLSTSANTAGQVFYIDRVMLVDGEMPGPYFDGSMPNSVWTGTAHASTSTCSMLAPYDLNTEEIIVLGSTVLNSLAWNVTSRTGRLNVPQKRGANTAVPTRSGQVFASNRPFDVNTFVLSMWALGVLPDGTIPRASDQRRVWESNMTTLLNAAVSDYTAITAYVWQADGTVRTAQLDLNGTTNVASMVGGSRGEFSLAFDVLDGWWSDWLPATITGTAGTGWSNQTLTMPQLAGGTAPMDDLVATVTGPAQSPKLTTVSGVWTQLSATMTSGQSWVLDSGNYTSTLAGTSNLTQLVRSGNHARFLSVPSKDSVVPSLTMTATGTTSATNLSVTGRRKHWGA